MTTSCTAERVRRRPVLRSYQAPSIPRPGYASPAGAAAEERVPLRGIRKKIAENMQMAKHIIPHFTLMEEVRVDELVKLRTQAKARGRKGIALA